MGPFALPSSIGLFEVGNIWRHKRREGGEKLSDSRGGKFVSGVLRRKTGRFLEEI